VSDTVAACLTAPGAAAIATIAVRGSAAWEIARRRFAPHSRSGSALPESPTPCAVWYGRFGDEVADEVVLGLKSISPIPWVEIHCHGGPQVVRLIFEALTAEGARIVDWRTFVSDGTDPLQALAALELAEARTARTAAILLDQYHGAFRDALTRAIDELERGDPPTILKDLARHARLGRHLVVPWRVTLAGAPNVGKSSLANAIAGYQRSVVSPIPGTTRDVVTTTLAIDGWPVEIADTAGVRDSAGSLESLGIERARSAAASADLCLWVMDASAEPIWPDVPDPNLRLVVNKVDLPPVWDLNDVYIASRVSASTGAGVRELIAMIGQWLVGKPPAAGTAIPFTPSLADRVEEALRAWESGESRAASGLLRAIRQDRAIAEWDC
jgi:tRNA modification GTPase